MLPRTDNAGIFLRAGYALSSKHDLAVLHAEAYQGRCWVSK
jgi:hypothetical protein